MCHVRGWLSACFSFPQPEDKRPTAGSEPSAGYSGRLVTTACSRGTNHPACLGLRGFSGCRTFSAKTRTILSKRGWVVPSDRPNVGLLLPSCA